MAVYCRKRACGISPDDVTYSQDVGYILQGFAILWFVSLNNNISFIAPFVYTVN